MDYVILMGTGTLQEWDPFDIILETFCKASGMSISIDKSCFLHNNIDTVILTDFSRVLPYHMELIHTGFKYLGFYLKPLGYRVYDWYWLVQEFKKRISLWTHKILSLGGKLILVQSILSSIPMYWMGLAPIPVSTLHKLRRIMVAFLWGSSDTHQIYHLVCWKELSWPKK